MPDQIISLNPAKLKKYSNHYGHMVTFKHKYGELYDKNIVQHFDPKFFGLICMIKDSNSNGLMTT